MVIETDKGDPSVGYSGGAWRARCLGCFEEFTEEELDKLSKENEDANEEDGTETAESS